MEYYSAESIIAELEANNILICEGTKELGCPSPAPFSVTHEERVCKIKEGIPCDNCMNQTCNQWVIIRDNKYTKLGMLMFMFIFAAHPKGRIPKYDSLLKRLIKHALINENNLVAC